MVNYNTTDLVVDSLSSLRSAIGPDGFEVIVVDNASDDFEAARVLAAWPDARIVESDENLGFGRGNNLGASYATGKYLWLLNSDTLIPADHSFGELLAFLDEHPQYCAAAPLLTDADGAVQPWQTGYFPALWRMALNPLARFLERYIPVLRGRLGLIDTSFRPMVAADVEQAVAAALVVRREAFEAVGGFSDEYFFFLEDTDLCRKMAERQWKIRWLPGSHVVHLWGRSVSDPVARQAMFFSAQDIYLRRWHSSATLGAVRVMRLPLLAAARLRAWRSGKASPEA